jgi:hypothetical protein
MKIFWIVVLCAVGYIVMALLTIALMMLYDRLEGFSPEKVYNEYEDYIKLGFLVWWFCLPIVIVFYCSYFVKKWMIAIVETIVATKENKK